MKKFSYQLQQVLNVRLLQRDQADAELVIAKNKLLQEKEKALAIRDQIEQSLNSSSNLEKQRSSSYFMKVQNYLAHLRQELKSQLGHIKAAEIEVKKCHDALFEARKKVNQLEKHKDKQFAQWKEEINREETKFTDEVASILNQRKNLQDQ